MAESFYQSGSGPKCDVYYSSAAAKEELAHDRHSPSGDATGRP
jgi:hypothetical protein